MSPTKPSTAERLYKFRMLSSPENSAFVFGQENAKPAKEWKRSAKTAKRLRKSAFRWKSRQLEEEFRTFQSKPQEEGKLYFAASADDQYICEWAYLRSLRWCIGSRFCRNLVYLMVWIIILITWSVTILLSVAVAVTVVCDRVSGGSGARWTVDVDLR